VVSTWIRYPVLGQVIETKRGAAWPDNGRSGRPLRPEVSFLLMTHRARKVFEEALQLPLPERAELAADLIASLDGEPDEDVEAAWAAEIERRAKDALAEPDDDIPWETVRAELKAGPLADE
jgi:putative addiction module component (TIGR02574 family)